jgi:RNA polymerase sigma factor (sigma-70 family)
VAPVSAEFERRRRFEALYEANYHRILGYALRRTRSDQAADIVAETFLVAWRRLEEVPAGRSALLWLYGVARRITANQKRSEQRRERLAEKARMERITEGADAEGDLVGAAASAFAKLGPREREVLALVAWEGLTPREIAEVCQCSRNAVRIRLHRARRSFKRELESASLQLRPAERDSRSSSNHVAFAKTEESR